MESGAKNVVSRTISVKLPRESRPKNRIDSAGTVLENYANFKRSGVPERVMWFDGVNWVDLEGEVLEVVKLGFRDGRAVVEGVVGCERCLFDFVRMMLVEFGSGRRRSVSWIDVGGNCFFPKSFVSDDTFEDVQIRIQVRLEAESKLGKRKRALHVELDHAKVVEYSNGSRSSSNRRGGGEGRRGNVLVKRAPAEGVARWPNCRLMRGEERGFRIVKSIFLEKARTVDPGVIVKSVCYFVRTSYTSRARYLAFKRCVELTVVARGSANVVYAWYGTTTEGVGRIMAHGFGVPSDVEKSHGVGVYLSPIGLPQLSVMKLEPDENGEKHVILCRVLLGKVEKVDAGSKQCRPTSTNYDNGMDDLKNPKRFIVWCTNMNTHILPQCVVTRVMGENLFVKRGFPTNQIR